MRRVSVGVAAGLGFACVLAARAASVETYRLVPGDRGATGIRFEIPYTMGIHRGEAVEATGTVVFDPDANAVRSAVFEVPIAAIRTGRSKMECHLRSSLGLDYAASAFPERHVCDGGDRLPPTGSDAVVHPAIRFETTTASLVGRLAGLDGGGTVRIDAVGRWTIHGVTKEGRVALTVERGATAGTLRVRGSATFALADFGIVVKPFLFVKVKDPAVASFDLLLAHAQGPEVP